MQWKNVADWIPLNTKAVKRSCRTLQDTGQATIDLSDIFAGKVETSMVKLQQCIDCGREWKRAYQKTVRLLSKNTDRPWTFPVTQTAKSLQSVWDVEVKLCLPPAFIPCHFFASQLVAIGRFEGWFLFHSLITFASQSSQGLFKSQEPLESK